jgi:hypothetical protein
VSQCDTQVIHSQVFPRSSLDQSVYYKERFLLCFSGLTVWLGWLLVQVVVLVLQASRLSRFMPVNRYERYVLIAIYTLCTQ